MNRANPFYENKNIILHRLKSHTDEWFEDRGNSLGASDVPTVVGDNPFGKGIWQLWQEKSGLTTEKQEFTERMAMGNLVEDNIAQLWSFWHPNEPWWEDAVKFQKTGQGQPRRTCQRVNAVIKNTNYPWLSTNLDRLAPEEQFKSDFRTICPGIFQVEIKNIDAWVANRYEDQIPAYYHAQAQTQMLITEVQYYEFCVLVGGNHVEVRGYVPDGAMAAKILLKTHEFWYNNVLPTREKVAEANKALEQGSMKSYDEIIESVYSLYEPEAVFNEQYEDYMRARYKHEINPELSYDGDPLLKKLAIQHKIITALRGRIDKRADVIKTQLEHQMRELGRGLVIFDTGKISWTRDKGKDMPTFRNYVISTKNIDVEGMEGFIEQLNFEDYVL